MCGYSLKCRNLSLVLRRVIYCCLEVSKVGQFFRVAQFRSSVLLLVLQVRSSHVLQSDYRAFLSSSLSTFFWLFRNRSGSSSSVLQLCLVFSLIRSSYENYEQLQVHRRSDYCVLSSPPRSFVRHRPDITVPVDWA